MTLHRLPFALLLLPLLTASLRGRLNPVEPSDYMQCGTFYYPEHWDSEEWARDMRTIGELGFEFVHMAEFAWAQLEPEENRFDFRWLDEAIDLAEAEGLKVILGTPSAAPPAWLTHRYPEVLLVQANGQPGMHGTRQFTSWSSPRYRELVGRVVEAMARHYGQDKRIWGWQIDNEPSHYGVLDYNPAVTIGFRAWLKNKYTTVEALNEAWGTVFWSGTYTAFEEVNSPNAARQFNGIASPASWLDFRRFQAAEAAEFINLQARILRRFCDERQWITTNATALVKEVDAFRFEELDFLSYTLYPAFGLEFGLGEGSFRTGNYLDFMRNSEYARSFSGVSGCMEIQPGQINWGVQNAQLLPGTVRAWLWHLFALEQSFAASYRFRQPRQGGEQYHFGMVGTDGVTLQPGGVEYGQFMREVKELRQRFAPAPNPEVYEARRTAYLLNYDNVWSVEQQPQTVQWSPYNYQPYAQLKRLGAPVDFVEEDDDWSRYRVLVAPFYEIVTPELVAKWRRYVEGGGHLVLGCRSGHKGPDGSFWPEGWAAPLRELIGGEIRFFDALPADYEASVVMGSEHHAWNNWGDVLAADEAEVWAAYGDQFYAGAAAVLHHRLGAGTVTYIGVDSEDGALERAVLERVFNEAGILTEDLPAGLCLEYRDGFGVAVNYRPDDVEAPVPDGAEILFGKPELGTAEVVVWRVPTP